MNWYLVLLLFHIVSAIVFFWGILAPDSQVGGREVAGRAQLSPPSARQPGASKT
jgi:hypothetical protein